jgi:hypothetical protein
MPVAFYMDEHVDSAITNGLRARGIDAMTVQEDGHDNVDDPVLLDRAGVLGRVMVTQDKDFLIEAARRQRADEPFVGVIYSPQRGPSIGQVIAELEYIGFVGEPEDLANRATHLPLRAP